MLKTCFCSNISDISLSLFSFSENFFILNIRRFRFNLLPETTLNIENHSFFTVPIYCVDGHKISLYSESLIQLFYFILKYCYSFVLI